MMGMRVMGLYYPNDVNYERMTYPAHRHRHTQPNRGIHRSETRILFFLILLRKITKCYLDKCNKYRKFVSKSKKARYARLFYAPHRRRYIFGMNMWISFAFVYSSLNENYFYLKSEQIYTDVTVINVRVCVCLFVWMRWSGRMLLFSPHSK